MISSATPFFYCQLPSSSASPLIATATPFLFTPLSSCQLPYHHGHSFLSCLLLSPLVNYLITTASPLLTCLLPSPLINSLITKATPLLSCLLPSLDHSISFLSTSTVLPSPPAQLLQPSAAPFVPYQLPFPSVCLLPTPVSP
jgi:hypothetical protein